MATIYSAPKEIEFPKYNPDTWREDEKQYLAKLSELCKNNSKCKDAGEVIGFPIADGKALYMVVTYTKLIHIELGDAYSIPDAHARGLRKTDIVAMINQSKAIAKLFA